MIQLLLQKIYSYYTSFIQQYFSNKEYLAWLVLFDTFWEDWEHEDDNWYLLI